jgi:hypothetical protein
MQVAISKLTTLADSRPALEVDGSTGLWFLQCLLAHVVSAVDTFVAGEVRMVTGARPDAMAKHVSEDAQYCSRQARQPGDVPL